MSRQRGFSLLEVLVAFAVLALSLGVLYQAFGHSLRNLSVAGDYDRALILAEARLGLAAARRPLEVGREQGRSGPFRWQVTVEPYRAIEDLPGDFTPYRLRAEVRWREGGRDRVLNLDTLRLGPP